MRGYQVAVAVLAALLMITAGVLSYVVADRYGGDGEASRTADAPASTAFNSPVQYSTSNGTAPSQDPAAVEGDHGEDADDQIPEEACHHCGGCGLIPCGVCGGSGSYEYGCPPAKAPDGSGPIPSIP